MEHDINAITALRLQLLANGYTPIRNRDKRTFMKGWPQAVVDEGEIARWGRRFSRDKATGIRVEDGLAVIDFDIDDKTVMAAIVNAVLDALPQLEDENVPLLVRSGKGSKEAWFVRTDEVFSRIHSRAWLRPGSCVDDGAHRVEIFGGASPRQFGSFGPHTIADDGSAAVLYRWNDRSPADTSKSELPALTKKEFFLIADIVERELEKAGWTPVAKTTKGENDVQRIYDLTEDMSFDIDTGERLSLLDLRERAAAAHDAGLTIRCSASFLEGPSAKRTDRCIVSVTQNGGLAVWESSSGVTHCEASLKPRDFEPEINRIAEKLKELDERRRNKVVSSDRALVAATKMLATYAFCPNQPQGVVPIYASSMDEGMTMQAFRTMLLPNSDEEVGPRGGRKIVNPADIWAGSERRKTVQGLRMRPDKERPLYEDAKGLWINTYSPPMHDAKGGSPSAAIALLDHLLPDQDEKRWFTQWLAHKVRYPFIPGPAVIMVARQFGTGRGTLSGVMARLLGPEYVVTLPFHMFGGKSYQSQYDDWGAGTLMACVAEAAEHSGQQSTYRDKQDTYTHLKSLVEPRAMEKRYTSKKQHFKAMSFTSFFIATNEVDALPIPANDRRFAVLTNGDAGTPDFWREINTGLERDENIAAFHDWLLAYDLTGYNPYEAPPRTQGQMMMVEMAKSDIDRGVDLAFEKLTGDVYTVGMVLQLMRDVEDEYGLSYPKPDWQAIAKRQIERRGYRIGVPHGANWTPMIAGKRVATYATSEAVRTLWKERAGLREEVLRVLDTLPKATPPGDKVVAFTRSRSTKTETDTQASSDTARDTEKKD